MKRVTVYAIALSVLILLLVGCSDSKDNFETIILPVVSLKSTGEEIIPQFYENGFDFNYETLPTLALAGNEDVIQIVLPENFPNKVVIGEDYYKYTESTGTAYKEIYELEKDGNNIVLLPVNRRGNVKDEQAIYSLISDEKNNEEVFVFKLTLAIDEID